MSNVGTLIRDWRQRRRLSQMDLALEAGISTRHLSFVETGRSKPSAEMVLLLAERLDVPLRERNQLLLAAGYAPRYGELDLEDPELAPVKRALELVLAGHEPYPACVVDRQWGLVAANSGVALLLDGVDPAMLAPPVNVLRLSLHPEGLAPRIRNLGEWRGHLLARLEREITLSGDAALAALRDELIAYPGAPYEENREVAGDIAVPLRVTMPDGAELSFFSTVATFGTAIDVTVAELSIESFFPADGETADYVRERAGAAAA
ncbi:MAG TPA: helix-turn-helix transcriptional regulator [Solirubrobacteraceae bacterium]